MHNLNAVLLAAEMEPRLFDLDFQLLADSLLTIIAVFVLFIALSYLLFNPARKFMQDRQNKIAGELDHAKTAQEDAEKLKADYEARLGKGAGGSLSYYCPCTCGSRTGKEKSGG